MNILGQQYFKNNNIKVYLLPLKPEQSLINKLRLHILKEIENVPKTEKSSLKFLRNCNEFY